MESLSLPVSGMTCGGCARTIQRKLSSTPGVAKASVDLEGKTATVEFDPSKTGVDALVSAIEKLGYQVPRP
ncbi:MAG: heavy-metal-associated domain-containing protein [Bryobacteraceae bacterium]